MIATEPTRFERLGRCSKLWALVPLGLFAALVGAKALARYYGGVFLPEPFGVLVGTGLLTTAVLWLILTAAVWLRDELEAMRSADDVARRVQDSIYRRRPPQPYARRPAWDANTVVTMTTKGHVYGKPYQPVLSHEDVPPIEQQIEALGQEPDTGDVTRPL